MNPPTLSQSSGCFVCILASSLSHPIKYLEKKTTLFTKHSLQSLLVLYQSLIDTHIYTYVEIHDKYSAKPLLVLNPQPPPPTSYSPILSCHRSAFFSSKRPGSKRVSYDLVSVQNEDPIHNVSIFAVVKPVDHSRWFVDCWVPEMMTPLSKLKRCECKNRTQLGFQENPHQGLNKKIGCDHCSISICCRN